MCECERPANPLEGIKSLLEEIVENIRKNEVRIESIEQQMYQKKSSCSGNCHGHSEEHKKTETTVKSVPTRSELINKRDLGDGRMGLDDSLTNTNLISKNWSPAIIRKYNIVNGWPLFIGMICDENLSDLDKLVSTAVEEFKTAGLMDNNIQNMRNFAGYLSESIVNYYNSKKKDCVEGVAIFLYVDKLVVQSLYGDYMNHGQCKMEFYETLSMLPHI